MDRARSRTGALAALVALASAVAPPARAQDGEPAPADYDVGSAAWNGLATFAAVARGLGLRVTETSDLRWDELGARDVVVLVYPTAAVEASRLSAFARRGGRVAIADDFGAGGKLLAHFGLLREPAGPLPGSPRLGELAYAPIARPLAQASPLAEGVRELAANHPATFSRTSEIEPIFGFGPDEVLVAAGSVGDGRLVAIADPSVLINRMLELEHNLQFAINLLRFLDSDGRSERLVLVTGHVQQSGRPSSPPEPPGPAGRVATALEGLNDAADEIREYLLTEKALRAAALALAGLVAIACVAAPGASRQAAGDWVRAEPRGPVRADLAALFGEGARRGARVSWAIPAAVVRDNLDRRLGRRLGIDSPLSAFPDHELYRRVDREIGREAALALARAAPLLAEIPARGQAGARGAPPVSRRAFDRLHSAASRLERILAAQPRRP